MMAESSDITFDVSLLKISFEDWVEFFREKPELYDKTSDCGKCLVEYYEDLLKRRNEILSLVRNISMCDEELDELQREKKEIKRSMFLLLQKEEAIEEITENQRLAEIRENRMLEAIEQEPVPEEIREEPEELWPDFEILFNLTTDDLASFLSRRIVLYCLREHNEDYPFYEEYLMVRQVGRAVIIMGYDLRDAFQQYITKIPVWHSMQLDVFTSFLATHIRYLYYAFYVDEAGQVPFLVVTTFVMEVIYNLMKLNLSRQNYCRIAVHMLTSVLSSTEFENRCGMDKFLFYASSVSKGYGIGPTLDELKQDVFEKHGPMPRVPDDFLRDQTDNPAFVYFGDNSNSDDIALAASQEQYPLGFSASVSFPTPSSASARSITTPSSASARCITTPSSASARSITGSSASARNFSIPLSTSGSIAIPSSASAESNATLFPSSTESISRESSETITPSPDCSCCLLALLCKRK